MVVRSKWMEAMAVEDHTSFEYNEATMLEVEKFRESESFGISTSAPNSENWKRVAAPSLVPYNSKKGEKFVYNVGLYPTRRGVERILTQEMSRRVEDHK